jgi:hypothetical protein
MRSFEHSQLRRCQVGGNFLQAGRQHKSSVAVPQAVNDTVQKVVSGFSPFLSSISASKQVLENNGLKPETTLPASKQELEKHGLKPETPFSARPA